MQCTDMIKRLAMAHPDVAFKLSDQDKTFLDLPQRVIDGLDLAADPEAASRLRMRDILGGTFADEAGISMPSAAMSRYQVLLACRHSTNQQRRRCIYLLMAGLFVIGNGWGRCAAYGDTLPRGRHPVVVLFLSLPPEDLDVNVHPAKTEVRFRDAGFIRGLVIVALQSELMAASQTATSAGGEAMLDQLRQSTQHRQQFSGGQYSGRSYSGRSYSAMGLMPKPR